MTRIADVMTRGVRTISPTDTVRYAAQAMDELDVGSLPVCDGKRLAGMVTDRDITLRCEATEPWHDYSVRCVAPGLPPDQTQVGQILSGDVRWCRDDTTVDEAVEMMQAARVRRLPVIDSDRNLVGIVSLGDIAVKGSEELASEALEGISHPAGPDGLGHPVAGGRVGGNMDAAEPSRAAG